MTAEFKGYRITVDRSKFWRQLVAKLNFVPNPDTLIVVNQEETTENQHLIFMRQLVAQIPFSTTIVRIPKIRCLQKIF
jgi:hypothetical protein